MSQGEELQDSVLEASRNNQEDVSQGNVKVSLCYAAEDTAVGRSSTKSGIELFLHDAVKEGDLSTCQFLIKSVGVDVYARNEDQEQLLHVAAKSGHVEVCRYLIENGADRLAEGRWKQQPIHYAARWGHVSVCEYLIESAGAHVNARSENLEQPLHVAAQSGHVKVCRSLIENGAHIDAEGFMEQQPIHYAASGGHVSVCQFLIKLVGVDVNARAENGAQPLHVAAQSGHLNVCKYLIENGADILAEGFMKQQPIHYAASGGHVSVCQYLIRSARAHVNARDDNGNCPLHSASASGHKEVCRFLLEINPDLLRVCNNEGEQAIFNAISHGHDGVFSYLLSQYPDPDLISQEMGSKLLETLSIDRHYAMIGSFLSRRAVGTSLIQKHWEALGKACLFFCDKDNLSYLFSCISEKQVKLEALNAWLTEAAQGHGRKFLRWLVNEGCKDDSGVAVSEHCQRSIYDILWSSDARIDVVSRAIGDISSSMANAKAVLDISKKTKKGKASAKTVHKSLCQDPFALASHRSKTAVLKKILLDQYVQELEDDHDFCNDNTKALKAYLLRLSKKEIRRGEDIFSICLALVRNGADIHVTDKEEKSLLHYVASDGREEMCRLLLERGANPLAKDSSGKLSWEMAFSSHHKDLATYLRKFSSIPDEILAEGGDAVNVYSSAFKDGAASCTFFRVDVVGKDGCGKTSLIKSLTRQKFNLKEPSTEGVETACEVVVQETCNWAKRVEIRERKRVYDKAAAAAVAKRLKETNPGLGEDVPQGDGVFVIDKAKDQSHFPDVPDELDKDEILECFVSSLSENETETRLPPQEGVGDSLNVSDPSPIDNQLNSVAMLLRRYGCTTDKINDEHQVSREADGEDKDKIFDSGLSLLSGMKRHLSPNAVQSPSSDLSSVEMLNELPSSKGENPGDSNRCHPSSNEEDAHNEDESKRTEEDTGEVQQSLPYTSSFTLRERSSSSLSVDVRKSDNVSLSSPSTDAHVDVNASNTLSASVGALTRVYLADPAALNQASSDIYIDLLDYGGQHIYYTTHFSFLNKEAIYFVVFDVSLPLGELAKSSFRSPDGKREEIAANSTETNYDRLEEWLSSICLMEPPGQPSLPADGRVDRQPPYIFLVGTHRDKLGRRNSLGMQKFLKEQNVCLKEKFEEKDFSSYIIPASSDLLFYAVDNTKSLPGKKAKRDPSIIALEKDVEDFAKKISRRIPLRWLKFEAYVRSLKTKNPDKKVISIKELREAASKEAKVFKDEEFDLLIHFLTNRAVLLYHPLPGVTERSAVVDVQWLTKVFQKVVTVHLPRQTPPRYLNDLERAKCRGIVTSSYLSHLLSDYSYYQKEIEDLLIFFDIICPYKILEKAGDSVSDDDNNERDYVCLDSSDDDDRKSRQSDDPVLAYFVPCLLTKDEGSCAGKRAPEPLVLFSKKYRIPQTLFYRVMTRLAGRFGRFPRLHPSVGYFVVHYDHRLEIRLNKFSISFTVFPIRGDKVLSQVCGRVREFVVATAKDCKKNGMAGLELHLGCLADDSSSVAGESFFLRRRFLIWRDCGSFRVQRKSDLVLASKVR